MRQEPGTENVRRGGVDDIPVIDEAAVVQICGDDIFLDCGITMVELINQNKHCR